MSAPRASWSLTARLTGLYCLLATITLLVLTGVMYWFLATHIRGQHEQFLADKLDVLGMVVQERTDPATPLRIEMQREGESMRRSRYNAYYARVRGGGMRELIETPGMNALLPESVFEGLPPTPPGHAAPAHARSVHSSDGRRFLIATASVASRIAPARPWTIEVALDVSRDDLAIAGYRNKLALVLAVGMLLSGLASWFVAQTGIRPVFAITRAVERTTAENLRERISHQGWPAELVVLARAFDDMRERLSGSFSRLSDFSSNLAHELRTPINNLMGEAEVALAKTRTPAEYRKVLESSMEEYTRLQRLVESLLFLARAEGPQPTLNMIPLRVADALESVRDFYDALAAEQGVEVTCQGDAELYADPVLFRRAISNLLANALRHTPAGGTVLMSAAADAGGSIIVSVSDTGSGMDAKHLERIFDRFYRVAPPGDADRGGTGLGLSIVKSIMGVHGGSVDARSTPGRGTTVTLRFPDALADPAGHGDSSSTSAAHG